MASPLRCIAATAVCWSLGATLVAAQVVVLNARGPSAAAYPQGAVLPTDRLITLKAGDQLEVLDAAGSHVLTGPASLRPGQVNTKAKADLTDIFRRANASRPGIAAVRGFTLQGAPQADDATAATPLWRLDVPAWQAAEPSDVHNFCVRQGRPPVLTRGAAQSEASLTIYHDPDHLSRTVIWPAGSRDLSWPDGLSYADGQTYALNLNAAGATTVRWRAIPATSATLVGLAQVLLDNDCFDQLDTLRSETPGA